MTKWIFPKLVTKLTSSALVLAVVSFSFTSPVMAQEKWGPGCVGTGSGEDVATIQGITCLAANVLNVVLTLLGFVGFGMLVWGAFNLLISGGQPSHLEKAKNTIVYVVGGLFLAVGSYAIMQIVNSIVTGGGGPSIMELRFAPDAPEGANSGGAVLDNTVPDPPVEV